MEKQDYRQEMQKKRDKMNPSQVLLLQKKMKKLFTEKLLERADIFFIFASFGSEPDTFLLMEECFRRNKMVYLPKTLDKMGQMDFFRIKDTKTLFKGYMGIPEPEESESTKWTDMTFPEKTVMLLPGFCFDRFGHRIGYGGGYYDRYLSRVEDGQNLLKTGFCYAFQILEEIPVDSSDYSVDHILSEEGLWEVNDGLFGRDM